MESSIVSKVTDSYDKDCDLLKVEKMLNDLGVGHDYEVLMGCAYLSCAMRHDKVNAYVSLETGFTFDLSGKFIRLYIED